jgi:hypothetical protein
MWNIPREIYDAACTAEDYCYPDALNPIFWFYMFCLENPHDMIGQFITKAINSITDEDILVIKNHAKEYRRVYFDEEDEVVSPVNPGGSIIEDFDSEIDVEVLSSNDEE